MTLFQDWYDSFEDGTMSMDGMARRAVERLEQTKATNPDFYFGPVTGLFVRNAAYIFAMRLFGNGTEDGVLSMSVPGSRVWLWRLTFAAQEIARNLYGVHEEESGLVYRKGWERLPENWHKRSSDWGLLDLNADILDWTMKHPKLARYLPPTYLNKLTIPASAATPAASTLSPASTSPTSPAG